MPPSRGLWLSCHPLSRVARPPAVCRASVRQLSSASLYRAGAASAARSRIIPIIPPTSLLGAQGKANYSIWPFSKGSSESSPTFQSAHSTAAATSPSTSLPPANPTISTTVPSSSSPPPSSSSAGTPAATSLPEPASQTETSSIVEQLSDTISTSAIPQNIDHVGQLKELGLDFGWGPTATVEWVVEHIHVYAGTPWWGTIVLAALVTRALMAYPFYKSSENAARMNAIKDTIGQAQESYKIAKAKGDKAGAQTSMMEMNIIRKRAGISPMWMLVPLLTQAVMGFGAFRLMRAMCTLPAPGLDHGGFGWLSDLTVPDPLYLIPVAMAAIMHLTGRAGGESGMAANDPKRWETMKPIALYLLPGLMCAITIFQPAALQLTFLVGSVWGILQSITFRSTAFRNLLGMTPMVAPPTSPAPPASTVSATTPPSGAETSRQASNSPFGNVKLAPNARIRGHQYAQSVAYQAPTAQEVLAPAVSAATDAKPQTAYGRAVDVATKPVKGMARGVASWSNKVTSNLRDQIGQQDPNADMKAKGDVGRDEAWLRQAKAYEQRRKAGNKKN